MNNEVISLFSGAGGLSLGFARAGLKPVMGFEIDANACETYSRNLGVQCHQVNIGTESGKILRLTKYLREPFAVIGGPPCQGFSSAGSRSDSDPRNQLIYSYLEIVNALRPRWFLFENVEGLLTSNDGRSVYELLQKFIALGYWVRLEKLNFAGYGLPQARKRVLIVGNRVGADFRFPKYTHSFDAGKHRFESAYARSPSIVEAIGGLGQPGSSREELVGYISETAQSEYDALMRQGNDGKVVTLHYSRVNDKDARKYSMLRPGQSMKDLPQEFWHKSYLRRANRRVSDGMPTEKRGGAPSGIKRLVPDYNSLTITSAATREFVHPIEDRTLTLREAARLQSFPDNYEFAGGANAVATQIGNAVPPLIAEIVAREISRADEAVGRLFGSPRLLGYVLTQANGMSPALKKTEMLLESLLDQGNKEQMELSISEGAQRSYG